MTAGPRVVVVVPTHESRHWVERFFARGIATADDIACVVVDNGSADGTPGAVRAARPDVAVLELRANLGYGAAANRGAAVHPDADVFVVNPDVEVSDADVRALRETLETTGAGLVAPRLLEADGRTQHSAHRFPTLAVLAAQAAGLTTLEVAQDPPPGVQEVDWVPGAALLVRRGAWDAVDGFDPGYFFFVEDVDLQRRLATAGHRRLLDTRVAVVHHGGPRVLPAERYVHTHDGWERYFARHAGRWHGPAARALLCAMCVTRLAKWTARVAVEPGRRAEAAPWVRMFAGALRRSAAALPAAVGRARRRRIR